MLAARGTGSPHEGICLLDPHFVHTLFGPSNDGIHHARIAGGVQVGFQAPAQNGQHIDTSAAVAGRTIAVGRNHLAAPTPNPALTPASTLSPRTPSDLGYSCQKSRTARVSPAFLRDTSSHPSARHMPPIRPGRQDPEPIGGSRFEARQKYPVICQRFALRHSLDWLRWAPVVYGASRRPGSSHCKCRCSYPAPSFILRSPALRVRRRAVYFNIRADIHETRVYARSA